TPLLPTCVLVDSGAPPRPPAATYAAARVCGGVRVGVGCPAGQVCAPRGGGAPLCVSRAQDAGDTRACPPVFGVAHVLAPKSADPNAAFADQRACAPCVCTAHPRGYSCNVTANV